MDEMTDKIIDSCNKKIAELKAGIVELKAGLELAKNLLDVFGVHNCMCNIYLAEQVKLEKNIPLDSKGCNCGFEQDMKIIRELVKL